MLYDNTTSVVRTPAGTSPPFAIRFGLHQGSALVPFATRHRHRIDFLISICMADYIILHNLVFLVHTSIYRLPCVFIELCIRSVSCYSASRRAHCDYSIVLFGTANNNAPSHNTSPIEATHCRLSSSSCAWTPPPQTSMNPIHGRYCTPTTSS